MKKIVGTALMFAMAMSLVTGCIRVEEPEREETTEVVAAEAETGLKDNFYYYVNAEELKSEDIIYSQGYGRSSFDQDVINDRIKEIIDDVLSGDGYVKGSEEDLVKTAYNYYVEYDFKSSGVPADIASIINEIRNADSIDKLMKVDAKMCEDLGMESILNLEVKTDMLDTTRNSIIFIQYSELMGADFNTLIWDYKPLSEVRDQAENISSVFFENDDAEQRGLDTAYMVYDVFLNTDQEIMESSLPSEFVTYLDKAEVKEIFTGFDVIDYLKSIGYDEDHLDRFMVLDEGQFRYLGQVFTDERLSEVKSYELYRLIEKYGVFITPSYDDLKDQISYKDLDTQAKDAILNDMTDIVDPLYVENCYDEETDEYIRSMCDDIKEGYRGLITNADWLTKETRDGLLTKLDNIVYVTGTNLKRCDPNEYKDLCGKDYYEMLRNYLVKKHGEDVDKLKEKPDNTVPGMPMAMLNACYDPNKNNITITTAILIAPFLDMNADYYTNLGGIGMVIAHEMGHAFDSNCIKFDPNGRFDPSWINEKDVAALEERDQKAISYFEDNFTVFEVYHVDGEQTLGENYADLGGMECVVSLTKTKEDREKLFTNFAVIWSVKKTSDYLWDQLETDEHSPEILRTNSILSTIDEFYETYDIQEGDGMYIAPEDRISRWH